MSKHDTSPPSEGAPPPGQTSTTLASLAGGAVRRLGAWTVGVSDGKTFAVSSRCRHQLADLSRGSVDAQGCLVCPWHGARYDVRDGRMVDGPRGAFGYHGPSRGYRDVVRAYARFLPLRRRATVTSGDRMAVVQPRRPDRAGGSS